MLIFQFKRKIFSNQKKSFKYLDKKKQIIQCNLKIELENIKLSINTLHSLKYKK